MYSQNQEEKYILEYFGDYVGRLVDIGANNGRDLSNSKALIERGWKGVCVEPSPKAYAPLLKTHEGNGDVICLNTAIGTQSGFLKFYDGNDTLLSTLVEESTKQWDTPFTEIEVPCWTWDEFLLFHPGPYDFITIDAEMMDWEILQQIDLTDVKLLCVEHGGYLDKYVGYCEAYGMRKIYRSHENVIMGK